MTDPLLSRLQRDIAELCDAYDEGASRGPGLLHQLEEVEGRTLASVERSEGKAGKPGSKPPMPLDAVDLAMKIKRGAQDWCHTLGAEHLVDGYASLRRLPDLCATASDDTMHDLCSDVGRWRSTARTVLGYQTPAVAFPSASCPYCHQSNIKARPDAVRAWCATDGCEDEDGRQPMFERVRLLALIQEAS
jgi:hypothetical protein